MRVNKTKAKLTSGETVFGCFYRYPEPGIVEVLSYQGWDFILFDGEHGTLEPRDCENLARAAELHDVTTLVRVTTNLPPVILRYLDTGVQGAQIPMINSKAEAEASVRAVKYHPRGVRGLAGVRADDYAQRQPFKDYVVQANDETMVIAQVETGIGAEQISEIVEVPDIDVIFIGQTDLSHSLGVPGDTQHPIVQAALDRIVTVVNQSDKALGVLVPNAQGAQAWRERGARYIVIGMESLLGAACRNYLEAASKQT
ncbi:MAG: aldolase/citrate lyase family protein [Acidobacteria bacterium]|nr:aldolase/citrate lyase family protein [Acidobacteriota bacterium]